NGAGDSVRATDEVTTGNTIIVGNGAGDTVFIGLASLNTIKVGNGNSDVVNSESASSNTIPVGNGNGDVVNVSGGGNTITVGNGNGDVVNDSVGGNTITVSNGNDTVYVGKGDTVTVGTGQDGFVFAQTAVGNIGAVTINHFNPSKDLITFSSQLTTAVSYHDNSQGNAVVTVDISGDTITLVGVHS